MLDHQNKDMLIFEGLIGGKYWAQTRPLGELFFAYPPGSQWRAGPVDQPRHQPRRAATGCRIIEPGDPPARRHRGDRADRRRHPADPDRGRRQARLADAVARGRAATDRRHLPHLLVAARPRRAVEGRPAHGHAPLIEANPELTEPIEHQMYLHDVVFTTGIADAGDHYIVASGEADLACRITHIPKAAVCLIACGVCKIGNRC